MIEDAYLVRRARQGDRTAMELLVDRHVGSVRATVLSALGPGARGKGVDVDDVVQEAILRGLERLPELRDESRVGAWFRGIAHNRCRELWRERRGVPLEASEDVAAPEEEPVTLKGEVSEMTRAVWSLPEKLREAILLFYVEDLSYDQIGDQLAITPAAVNRRLTRARNLLRDRMVGRSADA